MKPELEDILKKLRGEDQGYKFRTPTTSLANPDKGYKAFKFSTPIDAVYDKLSDGSYIARYENRKGAVGNEERLANQQGYLEKAGYGVAKFVGKTGKNFLDATVGTVYGVVNGIVEGDMQAVWDNDFSNTMDDWNKTMNYKLPHYYTEEEKNKGLIGSMGTANFWFNDVGDGLAFVAGALLPEIAIGAMTGGASLGVSAGKFAFRQGAKALFKEGVEKGIGAAAKKAMSKTDDFFNYSKGRDGIREMYRGALKSKQAGDIASTAGFLFRTSNFEAGMEARNNYHDAIDNFTKTYKEKNGKPPTLEEIGNFSESAKNAANGVYGANLAILGVSNAAMFGKAFDVKLPKIGEKINNSFNRAIGLGVNTLEDGTMALAGANKAQRVLGNAYKVLSKPAIEGIYEEGMQGVAGKTMQNYLDSKYDPNSNHAQGMWSHLTDALAEQYGTKEGWKEMGIGMIIGMIGPSMTGLATGQGVSVDGFGKNSRKARQEQIGEELGKVNKGIETLRSMDRASSVRNFRNVMESKADGFQSTSAENTLANVSFVQSQEHIKGTSDIIKDYNTVIDTMQLDKDQAEQLEQSGISLDTYKDALKQEFQQDINNYNFAKKAVEAVGLDKVQDIAPGNRATIKDAMIMNLVLGKDSLNAAKNTAEQLEKLIKPTSTFDQNGATIITGGVFDSLQFYNNLRDEEKQTVSQIKTKQKQVKDLEAKNLIYQQELAGLQTRRKRKLKDSTLERNINTVSEKAVIASGQIVKLNEELKTLTEALDNEFTASTFDLDGTVSANPTNILATIEEIDKIENYINSLEKMGKNNEANSIKYLMEQFKFQSDSHREMMNGHRRMLDTNFFSSKDGKNFISRLIGTPYKMSDDFKQLVKDNDAKIDASLGLVGIRGYEKVEDVITEALEQNPELSEREKYKIEAMLRLQLNMEAIQERVDNMTNLGTEIAAEEETNDDPLDGDTIRLKQKLDLENRNLDNLTEITKVIKEITDQLDYVRNTYNQKLVVELEAQLAELKNQKNKREEDANKENNQEESTINNGTENQRVNSGQQEEGQRTGTERNTSTNEANNSNSSNASQVQLEEEIKRLEVEIERVKQGFKILESPEVIRLTELMAKDDNDTISTEEYKELQALTESVNDWMMITGTVVEGVRLSDLIRQKSILENTPIEKIEKVEEVTTNEMFETIKFDDNTSRVNYSYAQSPDAVTAIKKDGKIIVSGISSDDLRAIVGENFDFEITQDGKNNLILTEETIEQINKSGNVAILPTNKDLTTTYSVVISFEDNINGEKEGTRLKSPHSTDFAESMDTEKIYDLADNSEIVFEIDPNDPYNKKLIEDYNNAPKTTPEEIEEAFEILRVGAVIKVKAGENLDTFVSVLKAKNNSGQKSEDDYKFEMFRDQVINEALTKDFLTTDSKISVKSEVARVQKVMLGHPNFNFRQLPDGSVTVDYKRVKDSDVDKVIDIGYIENGEIRTKNRIQISDASFIKKGIDSKSKTKLPFVIIEKGGRRIAYPVRVVPREKQDNKEFEAVFNSTETTQADKVAKLNQMLAQRGINIKEPGEAFTSIGKTNLTKEFFDQKLVQLDNIDYFRPFEDWISKEDNMADILKEQVLININLSNPLHSPKIKIDFSEIYKNIKLPASVTASLKATKKVNRSKATKSVQSSALLNTKTKC